MDYQRMYEELQQENQMIRLRNDELSKMAYVMHTWDIQADDDSAAPRQINRLKNYCADFSKRYIYGAGAKAARIVSALEDTGFEGFVVSDGNKKVDTKLNHPIYELSEVKSALEQEGTVLIIALNPQNVKDVLPTLAELDLNSIYFAE